MLEEVRDLSLVESITKVGGVVDGFGGYVTRVGGGVGAIFVI
jgi:hypothetical protein